MQKTIPLFFLIGLLALLMPQVTNAQLVSENAFLQGDFVEVGIAPCGSFGSSVAAPAGFHPNVGSRLGFVADADKDGWTTGSPNYCGDYFLPGSPEEGWAIEIDGTPYNNNQVCSINDIPGSITQVLESDEEIAATWEGGVGGLAIQKVTTLPTDALYFITEITFTNTTPDTLKGVYYMRNVDPDQEANWGGGYATTNTVVEQNPNPPCNVALVSATGGSYGCYMGLGSKNSKARVTHGGFSNRIPSSVWNGSGLFNAGSSTNDAAVSIAFNLGDLAPGEVSIFAFAYVLAASDLTVALAATDLYFESDDIVIRDRGSVPACSGSAIPLKIENGESYTWTWSPSTGLDTTGGDSVNANLTSPQTYTISGTGACGSVTLEMTVEPEVLPTPGAVDTVYGARGHCPGSTGVPFSVDSVSDATYYEWEVPAGVSIISGDGTNSIEVLFTSGYTGGTLRVAGANACGSGTAAEISLSIDTEPPVVTTKNISLYLDTDGEALLAPTDVYVSGEDCSGIVTLLSVSPDSFDCGAVGAQTVTLHFEDGNGNSGSKTAVVTLIDTVAPAPIVANLPDLLDDCSLVVEAPQATDNCGALINAETSDPLVYDEPGVYTVDWVYTDAYGNERHQAQQLTIADTEAPVPDVATLPVLKSQCALTISDIPTAMDNCVGVITATTTDTLSYDEQGSYVITWTYDDGRGNPVTQLQEVNILDTEAPVPLEAELPILEGICEVSGIQAPMAFDACIGNVQATTEDPLSYLEQGEYQITWNYDDGRGNRSQQIQTIIVRDSIAPVPLVANLPDLVGYCEFSIAETPKAEDNCVGVVEGTNNGPSYFGEPGVYSIDWVYTDGYDNVTIQKQQVTVLDTVAPVADIVSLETVIAECEATVVAVPTATDGCVGALVATTDDPLTYDQQGTYTIAWKFDDGFGNELIQEQTVIIQDLTAPVPVEDTLPAIEAQCVAAVPAPRAMDACSGRILGSSQDPTVFTEQGVYVITWEYDDGNGNISLQTQTVTVSDTVAPEFEPLEDVQVCEGEAITGIAPSLLRDNCNVPTSTYELSGATVSSGEGEASGETFQPGVTTLTYTYDDGNGNQRQQQLTITVVTIDTAVTQDGQILTAAAEGNYQWINCEGTPVAGATGRSFTPSESGQYAVVISQGGCQDTSACFAMTVATTNIFQSAAPKIGLYPNPTTGILTVKLPGSPRGVTLRLNDSRGRTVFSAKGLNGSIHTLDLSNLTPGVYSLQVRTRSYTQTLKVVKE